MNIFNIIKDILAPKKCYSCWEEWHFLCEDCFNKIWYFESICPVCKERTRDFEVHFYCKKETISLDKVIILTHYQNKTIKKLIKDAKFYGKKDILEDMALYLWEKLFDHIEENTQDIILIPTPMYFWKKLKRWYNQSEILVKNMSKICQIDYNNSLIKKVRNTKAQSHLSKIERMENLQKAFSLDEKLIQNLKNKTFIIVDDVVSTGSTLHEIATLLKKHSVKKIYWLCIASD